MNPKLRAHSIGIFLIGAGLSASFGAFAASLDLAPSTTEIWTGFALASAAVILHDIPSITWDTGQRQTLFLATTLLALIAVIVGLKVQTGSFTTTGPNELTPIVADPWAATTITSIPLFFSLVAMYLRFPK